MYEQFYGFEERPFSLLPDPAFLYLGKKHRLAYSMLEYSLMNQAGFTVITGEVGSGKTTLMRHLLTTVGPDLTVGLISNTPKDIGQLLQWVMLSFGQAYREENRVALFENFTDFLIDQYAHKRRAVLIIDEAQNLSLEVLEELRMLSNINVDKYQILQLILLGQPELKEKLRSPELLQFVQRVVVDFHLTALDQMETREYIRHRIRHAGCQQEIFDDAACDLIYRASRGIPRVINVLCDTALVYGFADQRRSIDATLVRAVLKDKASTGLIRLYNLDELEVEPEQQAVTGGDPAMQQERAADEQGGQGSDPEEQATIEPKIHPLAQPKKDETKPLLRTRND
ncbi:MAG TPA: general secretion pathway protein [Sedimenticola sp.]|nr:general secretion pathway protein [Sedimenticola sp.]